MAVEVRVNPRNRRVLAYCPKCQRTRWNHLDTPGMPARIQEVLGYQYTLHGLRLPVMLCARHRHSAQSGASGGGCA